MNSERGRNLGPETINGQKVSCNISKKHVFFMFLFFWHVTVCVKQIFILLQNKAATTVEHISAGSRGRLGAIREAEKDELEAKRKALAKQEPGVASDPFSMLKPVDFPGIRAFESCSCACRPEHWLNGMATCIVSSVASI